MKSLFLSLTVTRIILAQIILILLVEGTVTGQRFQTQTYTEADGLANSMILGIIQDSSGVLWIGRRSGISSYDGSKFSNFNVNDGLRSTSYSFLSLDEKEKLWALPESGSLFVSYLEGGKWQTLVPNEQIPASFMATYSSLDVFYDKGEPVILAGTRNNGFILVKEKKWRHYTMADGLPSNAVNSVRALNGIIYIATDKGLTMLSNGILKPAQFKGSSFLSGTILAMERSGKKLWLLGKDWLGFLAEGKVTLVTNGFLLPIDRMGKQCFLHVGHNGKIYFGNAYRVLCFKLSANSLEILDRNNGLISEGGTSALVDQELNTWITGYRGITKISSERFASYYEKDGLYSNEVASAIEVSPGRYIFGHDGALTFYDGKVMTRMVLDPSKPIKNYETRVLDIQKNGGGEIWLAASSLGVAHLDQSRHITWYRDRQGLSGVAFTIAITPSGTVYAGTTEGLFQFNNGKFSKLDLGKEYNIIIRKIFPGDYGTLFLASLSSGLIIMTGRDLYPAKSKCNRLANNVYSYFKDSRNHQWVGTAAGLYELSGRHLSRVNEDGLKLGRPVYLILEDHLGNLWFGTDNGVYRWDGRMLDHFTVNEGLSGQDINRAAGFSDSQHHILFGTNNGLTIFRPELDYAPGQIPPPKVRLLSVSAGKDSLNPRQQNRLPYDLDDLVFQTRVISLINERQNFVKFYLENFDTGWSNEQHYTDGRFVYNNLRPGSYRFFLKARNSSGIWSEPVVSQTITIRPPFWLTWWFLLAALLLFSGIVVLTVRFILVNEYKNRLKEEVNLRTIELRNSEKQLMASNAAKDSFFSIIAHDLRSPFNVILGFLDLLTCDDSAYSETEQKQILLKLKSASVRTIDLLENLLTWARIQRGHLPYEPVVFTLGEVINENFTLFDAAALTKNISLVINGNQNLRVFADRNMISTVVRNLISNALKFTFPGGIIHIAIEVLDQENIQVSVKDNGMGISPALLENLFKIEERTVIKGTANETGTGLGLILCKEFIAKHGGTIQVESTHGSGSTFTFTLHSASSVN